MVKRLHQCKSIKKDGEQCGWESLVDDDYCIVHSQSQKAKDARRRGKHLTVKDRLRKLKQYAKRVEWNKDMGDVEKSRLLLQLYNKIDEYEIALQIKDGESRVPAAEEKLEGPLVSVD